MEGDSGIKQVKETRSVSILVGTTWSGYMASRPMNSDSTGNLPMSIQRQSSIPKAFHVKAIKDSRMYTIRQGKERVVTNNPWA